MTVDREYHKDGRMIIFAEAFSEPTEDHAVVVSVFAFVAVVYGINFACAEPPLQC